MLHWIQSLHFFVSSIQSILQNLQVVPSLLIWWFDDLMIWSFDDLAKLLRDTPSCCCSWGISSLTTVLNGIFFPLPPLHPTYSVLFYCNNFTVSRSLRHLRFFGKLFSGVSLKCLRNLMGNSYCKTYYSKGEVNVVEITQIRLQNRLRGWFVFNIFMEVFN